MGVNISGDKHKLRADFSLELGGTMELSEMCNARLLHSVEHVTVDTTERKWSLSGMPISVCLCVHVCVRLLV